MRRGWNDPTSRGDHHRARIEAGAARGADLEAPVRGAREIRHLLAEVKLRLEGLDLLHQSVDELLRAAHRQRRDVVDRLVRIQLRALPARMLQRIDDVRADAEQPQLEHLEQAAGAGADDDDLGA